jgi:hypothetical protein
MRPLRERTQVPVLARELMACLLGAVDVSAGVQRPVLVRRPGRIRLGRTDHDGHAARRGAFTQLRRLLLAEPGNSMRRS